jgi:predicted dithiol-disulfide oxidoreductase (DUF899 family)
MAYQEINTMKEHKIVSRDEWVAARKAHLASEKAFTRQRDALAKERRELPWVKIDKEYRFDTARGEKSLADLFDGRSQLIVQHFMFGPDWEEGCPSCSFWADGYNAFIVHLAQRDVTMIAVSNAPQQKLDAYKQRMGWTFDWVTSVDGALSRDFGVTFSAEELAAGAIHYNYTDQAFPSEEAPGASVFYRNDAGELFHTYSCYARGLDMLNAAYHYLDLAPKGRDEDDLPFPMSWVRRKDSYGV